jgi:hypothetical protein
MLWFLQEFLNLREDLNLDFWEMMEELRFEDSWSSTKYILCLEMVIRIMGLRIWNDH